MKSLLKPLYNTLKKNLKSSFIFADKFKDSTLLEPELNSPFKEFYAFSIADCKARYSKEAQRLFLDFLNNEGIKHTFEMFIKDENKELFKKEVSIYFKKNWIREEWTKNGLKYNEIADILIFNFKRTFTIHEKKLENKQNNLHDQGFNKKYDLKTDLINELLQKTDVEERVKLVKGLPLKVSDPYKVVEILKELFEHETNGEVLYFGVEILENDKMKSIPGSQEIIYNKLDKDSEKRFNEYIKKDMISIKAGQFNMGSPENENGRFDNEILHMVKVSDFSISRFQVTNLLYEQFDPKHKCCNESNKDNQPVVNVNWYEAFMFCRFFGCRLPTEAEWEYACRAGTITPFNTGENLTSKQANYGFNIGKTVPVGKYPSNPWGLHDMHGNVWEWCIDWYSSDYYKECKKQGIVLNPEGPQNGTHRILRGGNWCFTATGCNSAFRFINIPEIKDNFLGFRLVSVSNK